MLFLQQLDYQLNTLKPSSCCCLDQGKPNFEEAGNKTVTKVLHKQCVSLKQLSLSHFPFVRRIFAISWESMFLMKSAVSICKAKDINFSGFGRPKCHIFKNCKKEQYVVASSELFLWLFFFLLTGSSINPFVHHPDIIYSSSVVQFIDSVAHT